MIDDSRLNNIFIIYYFILNCLIFLTIFSGKNLFKLQTDLLNVMY